MTINLKNQPYLISIFCNEYCSFYTISSLQQGYLHRDSSFQSTAHYNIVALLLPADNLLCDDFVYSDVRDRSFGIRPRKSQPFLMQHPRYIPILKHP